MSALFLSGGQSKKFHPIGMSEKSGAFNEDWLQSTIFQNPQLVPMNEISSGSQAFIPICRELALPKDTGTVFLDIIGCTPTGQLTLIECKLWRNPQARREVIAQILEYASILSNWTYGDLTAKLKSKLGLPSQNPLFDLVATQFPDLDEATFVDNVSNSLRTGDFVLIIAGDGIRSDVKAITDLLNQSSGLRSRLSLLECPVWSDDDGGLLIAPRPALVTHVIERQILVDINGIVLSEAPGLADSDAAPSIADEALRERQFWDSFIQGASFDHPDQPAVTHGGRGWTKLPLPAPATHLTAYRSSRNNEGGFMLRLRNDEGEKVFHSLHAMKEMIERETGLIMREKIESQTPFQGSFLFDFVGDPQDEATFREWLIRNGNKLINFLRPFLHQLHSD